MRIKILISSTSVLYPQFSPSTQHNLRDKLDPLATNISNETMSDRRRQQSVNWSNYIAEEEEDDGHLPSCTVETSRRPWQSSKMQDCRCKGPSGKPDECWAPWQHPDTCRRLWARRSKFFGCGRRLRSSCLGGDFCETCWFHWTLWNRTGRTGDWNLFSVATSEWKSSSRVLVRTSTCQCPDSGPSRLVRAGWCCLTVVGLLKMRTSSDKIDFRSILRRVPCPLDVLRRICTSAFLKYFKYV